MMESTNNEILEILDLTEKEKTRLAECLEADIISQTQHDLAIATLERVKWQRIFNSPPDV